MACRTHGCDAINHSACPIGGGAGYADIKTSGNYTVTTASQLETALANASSGQTIFIPNGTTITYTSKKQLTVKAGVILASDRGYSGHAGGKLKVTYTSSTSSFPIFITLNSGARLCGLQVEGPDGNITSSNNCKWVGVRAVGSGAKIDNCFVTKFPYAGISCANGSSNTFIKCCEVTYCRKDGYGYDIEFGKGSNNVAECCDLDYFRHAIKGTEGGSPYCDYEVAYCYIGPNGYRTFIDCHGGNDNGDPYTAAGGTLLIHHNTIKNASSGRDAVGIRGIPHDICKCYRNWSDATDSDWNNYCQRLDALIGKYYYGTKITGNSYIHMSVYDNWKGSTAPSTVTCPGEEPPPSGEKFEYHTTGEEGASSIYQPRYRAQTFKSDTAHTVKTIKLKMYRVGSPGTVYARVFACDANHKPTGAALATGTINGSNLTTDTNGEWVTFDLGNGTSLSANIEYCIVIHAPNSDSSNKVYARMDYDTTYANGYFVKSDDAGSNWTVDTGSLMFEEWGEITRYSFTATISPAGSGAVSPANQSFDAGKVITVTALVVVGGGYNFDYWSGALSGSTNPQTLTMDGNKSVTANFVAVPSPGTFNPPAQPGGTPMSASWTEIDEPGDAMQGQNILVIRFKDDNADMDNVNIGDLIHLQKPGETPAYAYWGTVVDKSEV